MGPGQGGLPYRLLSLLPCHDIARDKDKKLGAKECHDPTSCSMRLLGSKIL